MGTFNAVVGALGVVSTILGVVLGAKFFGPDKRRTDADTMRVMSDVGIVWVEKYETLAAYVDTVEDYLVALAEWQQAVNEWQQQVTGIVKDALADRGVLLPTIPPSPPRPKRPPRQRKGE